MIHQYPAQDGMNACGNRSRSSGFGHRRCRLIDSLPKKAEKLVFGESPTRPKRKKLSEGPAESTMSATRNG